METKTGRGFRWEDGVAWIGDRAFPDAVDCWKDREERVRREGIRLHQERGLHLNLDNGWVLSIQWGEGNYCANYRYGLGESAEFLDETPDAEMWGWYRNSDDQKWPIADGNVLAYQSPAEALAIIDAAQSWPSPSEVPA